MKQKPNEATRQFIHQSNSGRETTVEGGMTSALRQAAENHDLSTVTSLAHKIAGAGSSYGFNQLSELSVAMKHAANENREAELLRLCLEMETCLQNPCIVYA